MKIIHQLAPKISTRAETLQSIHLILTTHALKGFLRRLTDGSVTYERQVYGNVMPFIETREPMAWCIFVNKDGDRVDARTGHITERLTFITDPKEVEQWYGRNLQKCESVVRLRYLPLLDYSTLPDGAIELYGTAIRKYADILRDQLLEL